MDASSGRRDSEVSRRILRGVRERVRCRNCGNAFRDDGVIILGQSDQTWLVVVVCLPCRFQGVLFTREDDIPDEPYSELSTEEHAWFASLPPLGARDVLAVRTALDEVDGDINKLWA